MGLKLDTDQTGLTTHLKPYEIIALDYVWSLGEPVGSGKVWNHVNDNLEGTISRASIIFFLNRQVDLGVLQFKDATGKGGHHRLYYPKVSKKDYPQFVVKRVVEALEGTFPGDPMIRKFAGLVKSLIWA